MLDLSFQQVYFGPSVFAQEPVLVAFVRLSELAPKNSLTLGIGYLRSGWPEWCSQDAPDSDDLASAARTIAQWALGALNEVRGCLRECGGREARGGAQLWTGFHHPGVSKTAVELACKAFSAPSQTTDPKRIRAQMEPALQQLWVLCRQFHPDYQARILMEGARAKGIPFLSFIAGSRYWQYGWGVRSRVFVESASNADGLLGSQWQKSKVTSHAVFESLGLPSPRHCLVNTPDELVAAVNAVGWPCVVKPMDRGGGRGVTAGINSVPALHQAFLHARSFTTQPVMVESFVKGDDYRLMVVDGCLVAAIRRDPPSVTGDGLLSIRDLIRALNATRSSNMVKSRFLRPIAIDDYLIAHLAEQGLDSRDVLESGRRVTLRSNANLSSGGSCVDVTAQVHKGVRLLAETVSQAFGLATAGVDYITTDITAAPSHTGGCLIEINTFPGLDAAVAAGWTSEEIATVVLGDLPARIPITLIVLNEDRLKTAVAELKVRWADASCGWVGGGAGCVGLMPVKSSAREPWSMVRAALRHRRLEGLAVLCSPAELVRHGAPVDEIAHTVLCGTELPEEWRLLLQRCSAFVEQSGDWETILANALTDRSPQLCTRR